MHIIKQILSILLTGIFSAQLQAVTLVQMDTSMGQIQLELYEDKAPETVANFVKYVESGYYNNLIFHRVIDEWIIQGGGYDQDMQERKTLEPIKNEANNGLKNKRGTIAMARLYEPHTADSQFFINLQDSPNFDFKRESLSGYGYCVFGKVVKGMDVVDAIGQVDTGTVSDFQDVPLKPVVINSVSIITPAPHE